MAKRTEEQILRDLQGVECDLSPENLTCDGELSAAQVRTRYTALTKKRALLVKELGREPAASELWGA
jgi:hypothetical protein